MGKHSFLSVLVILFLVTLIAFAGLSYAGNSVSGSITLNKAKIRLLHAYLDEDNPNSPIVALSDKPLPGDFRIGILSDKFLKNKKVHVLIFEISPKEKKLAEGGLGALYFNGKKTHYVAIANKLALTLDKIDDSIIEGKISTPTIIDDFYEITLSCEASFKVNRDNSKVKAAPPKKILVTGDASPSTKVYAEYYRACLAGDTGKMLTFLSSRARKEFESYDKDSLNMIAELCKTRPDEVKISKPSISNSQISFTVIGRSQQGEKATGSVKMLNEQGRWKVLEDKWEFISQ